MRLFRRKNDIRIMDNYVQQNEKIIQAANLLKDVYKYLLELNYTKLEEINLSIEKYRNEVSAISRSIEMDVYKSIILPTDKYVFLLLSEKVEKVMEKIIQTVRAISIRPMPLPGVNFLKDSNFREYVDDTIETINLLGESIKNLIEEKDVVEICHIIEDKEEKLDQIKLKMLKDLHRMEKDLEIFTIMQIENIIHRIDEISDSAEDASNIILIMHSLQSE